MIIYEGPLWTISLFPLITSIFHKICDRLKRKFIILTKFLIRSKILIFTEILIFMLILIFTIIQSSTVSR